MSDVFMTIVVPDYSVDEANSILAEYPGGADTFTVGCSATGKLPATHYISSGIGPEEYIVALQDVDGIDISDESWEAALSRLGLQHITGGDPSSGTQTSNPEE